MRNAANKMTNPIDPYTENYFLSCIEISARNFLTFRPVPLPEVFVTTRLDQKLQPVRLWPRDNEIVCLSEGNQEQELPHNKVNFVYSGRKSNKR